MVAYGEDNLSRRSATKVSLSSVFESWNAALANDGITTQTDYKRCSHTAHGLPKAWLQVDLKDYFSLKSVKIYYRDESNWPPYRFRQFYLDVSNSSADVTSTSQRIRCYKDETEEPDVPPAFIDISCRHTARYIIVGTSYDAPEDNPIKGSILEICEIEVYGCGIGKFGELCKNCQCSTCSIINGSCPVACSDNCRDTTCNQFSGYCTYGCKELYYGPKCEHPCSLQCNPKNCDRISGACSACKNGYYSSYCNQTCSPYCKYNICDFHTGECHHGCKSNWTGDFCNKCNDSHFGRNCSEKCSINCKGQLCNNVTRACTNGCETGFFKETCNEHCNPGCYNGCNRVTGYCDNGCVDGKFGTHCHENCGSGCLSKRCARINGNCSCANGWKGDTCTDLKSSGALDPTSVGLGAGVGSSVVILVFGIVFAIVIYNRREDNQKNLPPNILSEKNTSKNTVDVYVNEINRGFESKTYDGISEVDDKCGAMQKNEYLSISEAIQDMSIYDQLHL
ncbi:multiple epidermal growth factor-like domains protein 10 [Saccostrea cucullata]|uniref:multiple epidermal growth factor-like domains protein 10 n=1 Tax=Saccostrea cuccullata TaxID=36930 RepID=UPI002ED40B08